MNNVIPDQQSAFYIGHLAPVSILAQQIRNPLTSISLSADMLSSVNGNGEMLEYVGIIKSNVQRIEEMIEQLIYFGKGDGEGLESCSITELLEEVVGLNEDLLRLKNICLVTNYCADITLDVDVSTMKIAIGHIFVHAVENAKADKGEISIQTSIVRDKIVIQIQDNGNGIPLESIENFFSPFNFTKDSRSVLGLVIASHLLLSQKFLVHVESLPGSGNIFILSKDLVS